MSEKMDSDLEKGSLDKHKQTTEVHVHRDDQACKSEHCNRSAISEESKNVSFLKIREIEILREQCNTALLKCILIVCAFLCGFGFNLDASIRPIYTSYATSSFSEHSLLSTIQVINGVVSTVSQVVFARMSDHFGRLQLFSVGTVLYIVGTIIQSQAKNIGSYAVGAIFYNIGYTSVLLLLLLIMCDFSSLKWRLLYQYAQFLPYIIITWVSGNIVSASNPIKHWSWNIAMWAFIFPLSSLPLTCFLFYLQYRASKTVEWRALIVQKRSEALSFSKRVTVLFWKLDFVGLTTLVVCMGCILVPLTLAGGSSEKWADSRIIGTLVLGGVLFPVFLFWEGKFAKSPILPIRLLKDRGVWAPFCGSFFISFTYMTAFDYIYPVLLVGMNESETSASRISMLPTFVSTTLTILIGVAVARTKRMKPYVIGGSITWIVAMGILLRYRGGTSSHAGVVAGTCLMGVGSGLVAYPMMVSLQSILSHEMMAAVTGIYFAVDKIGVAIGGSVSGALWTQRMYGQISKRLGNETLAALAYGSPYEFIAEYAWESPERTAVVAAYRNVQRLIMIVSLAFSIPVLLCALLMRDRKLDENVACTEVSGDELSSAEDDDPIGTWFMRIIGFNRKPSEPRSA